MISFILKTLKPVGSVIQSPTLTSHGVYCPPLRRPKEFGKLESPTVTVVMLEIVTLYVL